MNRKRFILLLFNKFIDLDLNVQMKRVLTFGLLIILSKGLLIAQEKKAILGGNLGAMYYKNKSNLSKDNLLLLTGDTNAAHYKAFILQVAPDISFYLSERFLLGVGVESLSNTKNHNSSLIQKETVKTKLFYPVARYYFTDNFYLQGRLDYGWSSLKIKSESDSFFIPYNSINYSKKLTTTTFGYGIASGYSLMLGDNIMLDLAVNFIKHFSKEKHDKSMSYNGVDFKYNQDLFFLSLGFKYIITR